MVDFHSQFIKRCLDLSRLGRGRVAPNPIVGAVIVYQGKIIGEGFHQKVGGDHAEIEAISKVANRSLLKHATMYVSLEPCFHYGRTPPCVDSLLKYGFKEVVICQIDPDERVKGKSIEKLKDHGVEVQSGFLENEGSKRNAFFICRTQQQRPYIILKYAKTKTGIFGYEGEQLWISNPFVKRLVHRWRSEIGAILVGTNTALVDNPQLNNRLYFGSSPLRILLDRTLRIPMNVQLLADDLPTLVVTESTLPKEHSTPISYLQSSFDKNLIPNILSELYARNIDSLLVEGGATTLQQFLDLGYWDEARVFTSSQSFLPKKGKAIVAPVIPSSPSKIFQIKDNILEIYHAN